MVITIQLLPQFHMCASDASWVTIELISCVFAWKTSSSAGNAENWTSWNLGEEFLRLIKGGRGLFFFVFWNKTCMWMYVLNITHTSAFHSQKQIMWLYLMNSMQGMCRLMRKWQCSCNSYMKQQDTATKSIQIFFPPYGLFFSRGIMTSDWKKCHLLPILMN